MSNFRLKTCLGLLSCFVAINLQAGTPTGGFGGPLIKSTSIKGTSQLLFGGMGVSEYGNFFLGGGGAGQQLDGDYAFGYGGVYLGYRIAEANGWALIPNILLGGGSYFDRNSDEKFFLAEFAIDSLWTLHDGMALATSIGYRSTASKHDLSGYTATIGLRYGY